MRRGDPIAELRRAIDGLPVESRRAMLEGVRTNPIVVGAYTDSEGGICPMLAAHRHGGRTTFLAFARAWDRFGGGRRLRRATRREVDILVRQLEASVAESEAGTPDLRAAIADHHAVVARRRERAVTASPPVDPPEQIRAARLSPRDHSDAAGALDRFERELRAAAEPA